MTDAAAGPRVVGLDLSLRATGISTAEVTVVYEPKGLAGVERLAAIRDVVLALDADLFVIESYSFGSGNQAHQLGELGGVVRLTLWEAAVPYVDVPPARLKKAATGRGNATKSDMRAELIKRAGIDIRDDNRVDAFWLRFMGLHHFGAAPFPVPQLQADEIGKVAWPTLLPTAGLGESRGETFPGQPDLRTVR